MQDLSLDITNDLLIENSDLKLIDATAQDVKQLLVISPGTLRESGYSGIDLINELDEDGSINFKTELKKQLKLDNKKLNRYNASGNNLSVEVNDL
jgi:hypothetical protein